MRSAVARRCSAALIAFLILLAGSGTAFAQGQSSNQGFGVVVIGGPLFANLTEAQGFKPEHRNGFLVGLAFGGNRTGVVGVEADVLYGEKGAKIDHDDLKIQVVHVPVLLKVNIGDTSRASGIRGFGVVGPYFDWQFKSKIADVDISDDTEGFEAGLTFGGGIEVARLSIQARYIRGLRAINKKFELGSTEDIKSQSVAILFGFRLN